jgi:energy-coupling factor transporter ATP-binding protein EcfA2
VSPGALRSTAGTLQVSVPGRRIDGSARLLEVCLRFGLSTELPARPIAADLDLDLAPGTITLISGPSGAGKSLLLNAAGRQWPAAIRAENVPFPSDVAVIDAVAPGQSIDAAMGLLCACGLGEPSSWTRHFHELSEGERYRARLARIISMQRSGDAPTPLLCDDFAALLHRRVARSLAANLRKLVSRQRLILVVACNQRDIEEDLAPDRIVRLGEPLPSGELSEPPFHVERGNIADYRRFAPMHYRDRDNVGFVDHVFVLRAGRGGEVLGVVVYGRAALELRPRNLATGGRFVRNGTLLNRELRVLKRLIIHPDLRGRGFGHQLVRRTLPLVGVRFVECLASLGLVNPVFEKAGMERIGVCTGPPQQEEAIEVIRVAGADPLSPDFAKAVIHNPVVRATVEKAVGDWYRCTTGGGEARVARQSPAVLARTFRQLIGSRPVYYLWARDRAGWDLMTRSMAEPPEPGA